LIHVQTQSYIARYKRNNNLLYEYYVFIISCG